MNSSAQRRKFAVLYMGARMHYAVPALLEREGMLERFYTDVVAPPFSGRLMRFNHLLPARAVRLLGRQLPPDLPRSRVAQAPAAMLGESLAGWLRARGIDVGHVGGEASIQRRILREKFHGANAFYTLTNADLELVREAKRLGMFVVSEQMINPHVGLIMREERRRFPGVEPDDRDSEILGGLERDVELWKLSDIVLAPSEFVRNEILEHGIPSERVALVPYGLSPEWLETTPAPVPNRILFVGSVGLRKGNHYLAAAVRQLREHGRDVDVRVVGPHAPGLPQLPLFHGPTYVGQVPRAVVREEFRTADLFVFPTLAEGFALVHLEALACGVPVITTHNCGSAVRDGLDGFTLDIRDVDGLVEKIEQVLDDRDLRARMSANARERAREFTWSRYGERLLSAITARG